MALTREEILKLIEKEEQKIKQAEERKDSYQLASKGNIESSDEVREEALANKPQEKPLSKWFYAIAIVAGLLIVALIVIIILGIVSGWDFKF